MIFEFLILIFTLLVTITLSLIAYARWNYGVLERMGLPVEKPHWIFGNTWNLMNQDPHLVDIKKVTKLGPIYGHYDGRSPMVFIADPEAVNKLYFSESDVLEKKGGFFNDPIIDEMLEFLNGEKWKVIHNVLSPALTSGKIKAMTEIIIASANDYVKQLKVKMNGDGRVCKLDLHEFIAPYSMEAIASALCGIKIKNASDPKNEFVGEMRGALFDNEKTHWSQKYLLSFPFLSSFIPIANSKTMDTFRRYVSDVLDIREASGLIKKDTVGALLEMRQQSSNSPEYKALGINENTMFGQAFEFFVASYQGVVSVPKKMFYLLIKNPPVYRKLMEELEKIMDKYKDQISYESMAEMEYLGACIKETLRICPGFGRLERKFKKDWSFKGITIPEGTDAVFPLYAIHHNIDVYPQPNTFKPERFLPENKKSIPPGLFLGFGAGPRQCIGPRVAELFIKIFIVSILKEFKLEGRSDTIWENHKGFHIPVVQKPIYVDLIKK